MKVALDVDGTISEHPEFFAVLRAAADQHLAYWEATDLAVPMTNEFPWFWCDRGFSRTRPGEGPSTCSRPTREIGRPSADKRWKDCDDLRRALSARRPGGQVDSPGQAIGWEKR